jgi:hypothetical protein
MLGSSFSNLFSLFEDYPLWLSSTRHYPTQSLFLGSAAFLTTQITRFYLQKGKEERKEEVLENLSYLLASPGRLSEITVQEYLVF